MNETPSTGGSDAVAAPLAVGMRRVRVRVRRRRARPGGRGHSRWIRSRRRALRTAFLCAGLLLLMGTGVYLSLSLLGAPPSNPRSVVNPRR
jgi:hypothetical protein